MPRKHQVSTLVDLSLYSIGEFVITLGRSMILPVCDHDGRQTKLLSVLESTKYLLRSSVPRHLHDRMSVVILRAVVKLIEEIRGTYDYVQTEAFLSKMAAVLRLTKVAVDRNLRAIQFPSWPKMMRHVFFENLHDMTGLEVLDLGSGSDGWKTSAIEKIIINGVTAMPNLMCFVLCYDCTDNIVAALAQNCKKLQKLDVTASKSVTDRSVAPLLTCRYLREVKLFRTSVTISGCADLFSEHSCIEDIGRCDKFGYVLKAINQKVSGSKRSFKIKTLESRSFSMEHLYLLVDACPYITSLCLLRDYRIHDLSILATLKNLRELRILCCDFYTHGIKTLLEARGASILSLHLEDVENIDLNALVSISQFCPRMKSLIFYNCKFMEHTPSHSGKLPIPPFRSLERLDCVVEYAWMHLEFLLSHSLNIKFIQMGSSTGIEEATMTKILSQNPMSKLEELVILYSHDLSMKTVNLLMQNCENLRRLSELENWEGITSAELTAFREQLRVTNTNLDTSPTLSFV